MDEQTPDTPKGGYGKHSKSYWVIVYLIGAVILYGLIYLLFFYHSGKGGY